MTDWVAVLSAPDDGTPWLRIDAKLVAVDQAERFAEFCLRAKDDARLLIDAIRSIHLCITAVMFEALEGSAGVGAMTEKNAKATLEWLDGDMSKAPPEERTLTFPELVEAIQNQERLEYGPAAKLTDEQKLALKRLNWTRGIIEHPKHTDWSIPVDDVLDQLKTAMSACEAMLDATGHRLNGKARGRIAEAFKAASATL
jgi:hypothetical protein